MIVLVTTPLLGRRGITIIKLHGCLLPSRMASGARFASGRQGRPDRTAGLPSRDRSNEDFLCCAAASQLAVACYSWLHGCCFRFLLPKKGNCYSGGPARAYTNYIYVSNITGYQPKEIKPRRYIQHIALTKTKSIQALTSLTYQYNVTCRKIKFTQGIDGELQTHMTSTNATKEMNRHVDGRIGWPNGRSEARL